MVPLWEALGRVSDVPPPAALAWGSAESHGAAQGLSRAPCGSAWAGDRHCPLCGCWGLAVSPGAGLGSALLGSAVPPAAVEGSALYPVAVLGTRDVGVGGGPYGFTRDLWCPL